MNPRILFEKLLSIPKSFYVSMHYFPLRHAVKLPVLVRHNVKLLSVGGRIILSDSVKPRTGILSFGFGRVGVFDKRYERSIWEVNGTIEIERMVIFGQGARLSVGSKAVLVLGDNFVNTATMSLVCQGRIAFGRNVTVGWDTLVMDTDWHPVLDIESDRIGQVQKDIFIGDDVWLCTRSIVLKGSVIPDGCIVGANALVSNVFDKKNSLIAGNPAEIRRTGVTMYKDR